MRKLACDLLTTCLLLVLVVPAQTRRADSFDVIIRGGIIYDGTGGPPKRADVGIKGDRIAAIGNLKSTGAAIIVDATGLAVAPGFINMDQVIAMINKARSKGMKITADMYTYTAGSTGLDAAMPPWVFDGGRAAADKRLQDPETRKKIAEAIRTPSNDWENLYMLAGSPDRILLVGFRTEALKPLTGKTLAEAAKLRGKNPIETIMDLVYEDIRAEKVLIGSPKLVKEINDCGTRYRRTSLQSHSAS